MQTACIQVLEALRVLLDLNLAYASVSKEGRHLRPNWF